MSKNGKKGIKTISDMPIQIVILLFQIIRYWVCGLIRRGSLEEKESCQRAHFIAGRCWIRFTGPFEKEWQDMYKKLEQYIREGGNILVPQNHPVFGKWVNRLRRDKKKGKLSDEHSTPYFLDLFGMRSRMAGKISRTKAISTWQCFSACKAPYAWYMGIHQRRKKAAS